jgi:hypothetical protein
MISEINFWIPYIISQSIIVLALLALPITIVVWIYSIIKNYIKIRKL